MPNYKLILASGSPRRIELLKKVFPDIEIIVPDERDSCGVPNIDEHIEAEPQDYVLAIAEKKAMSVINKIDTGMSIIIAADTVVALDNKIFGKPGSVEEAKNMLKTLQGKEHNVYTGVVIIKKTIIRKFVEVSTVKIKPMNNTELDNYIKTSNWQDKAGAYGIQETPDIVESYNGDYYNIVGLPLDKTVNTIKTVVSG